MASNYEAYIVDSSCFSRCVWYAASGDLVIEYRNSGRTYTYAHVPRRVFDALMRAPSKGKFLNEIVKPNYGLK